MKLFTCQNCGQPLYFENTTCASCGLRLGYCVERDLFLTLELIDGEWRPHDEPRGGVRLLQQCAARRLQLACVS